MRKLTVPRMKHLNGIFRRAKRQGEKVPAPRMPVSFTAAVAHMLTAHLTEQEAAPVKVHVAAQDKRPKAPSSTEHDGKLGAFIDQLESFERSYLERSRTLAKNKRPVPNEGLIDIWKNYSTFVVTPIDAEEASWAHLYFSPVTRPDPEEAANFATFKNCLEGCVPNKGAPAPGAGGLPSAVHELIGSYALPSSVVSREEFLRRFAVFSSRQFEGWKDWNNMLVIGGAVVGCLLPFESEVKDLHEYYFTANDNWTSSDIDVYFYGLSDAEFGKKIYAFYQHLLKKNGKVAVMRTPYTVTFVSDYPARNIQIVLGRWASQAQILLEPDVDCSAVGFDGHTVWATERSRLSYNRRWLLATQEKYKLRTFPEYEERLYKYSRRGFAVVDRLVKGDFSDVSPTHVKIGRKRLMEHKVVRGRADITGMRLLYLGATDSTVRESVDLFKVEKYKTEGIPYGPEWNVDNICSKMMEPVYETTHYGPAQVESRFIVLKPETTAAKELMVSKPTFQRHRWYHREDPPEETPTPKSVATAEYFTNEIRLVNMDENNDESRRYEYQWHAYLKGEPEGREARKTVMPERTRRKA